MPTIKLHQQGDALTMTLPCETVERLGLQAGQDMTLIERETGFEVTTRSSELVRQLELAEIVLGEHADALKELARL